MKFLIFVFFAMEVSSSIIEGNFSNDVVPMNSASATKAPTLVTSTPAETNDTMGAGNTTYSNIMTLPQELPAISLNLTETDKTAMSHFVGAGIPSMSTTSKSNTSGSPGHNMNPDELVVLTHSQDTLINSTTSMPMAHNVTTPKVTPKPNGTKSSASSMNSISILLWSTALCSFLYKFN